MKITYSLFLQYIFLSLISLFLTSCREDYNPNLVSTAFLLAGISQNCISLDDCFDKYSKTTDEGATFQVFDSKGTKIYGRENTLSSSTYKPIASGSKWVTAITVMRAIDCTAGTATANCVSPINSCKTGGSKNLSLSTTTSEALSWTGEKGTITLRQLLSFTSGLNAGGGNGSGQATCISSLPTVASSTDKENCANSIRDGSTGIPGQFFQYNSNHMAIAMRILEVSCNSTWSQIFNAAMITPLGWDSNQLSWKGNFQSGTTTDGSMAGAYGLTISAEHYSNMMSALLRNGTAKNNSIDVSGFLSSNSITEILNDQYGNATIGYSQFASFGYTWRYGLGNWRYCSNTNNSSECDKDLISHSLGINGFYPFLDRNKGYFAILAVNNLGRKNSIALLPATANSLFFGETVRPYIHTLLGK